MRLLNLLGAVAALSLGCLWAVLFDAPVGTPASLTAADAVTTLRDSTGFVVDWAPRDAAAATGSSRVGGSRFRRIVSVSSVADGLLLELAEPERVLAYTRYSVESGPEPYRFAGKLALTGLDDLEALIALEPDLVLAHAGSQSAKIARLRAAGITVFDLGALRGVQSLLGDIDLVSHLLGYPERGRRLATRWQGRLERLAAVIAPEERRGGMYLAVFGGVLLGGTRGTSYHDVLEAAGVRDVAAQRYSSWPRYTSEQVLELDPELIVTQDGMAGALCRHAGLDRLRACVANETGQPRGVIEVERALLSSAGLEMLDAAESVFVQAYPSQALPGNADGPSATAPSSTEPRTRAPRR